MKAEIFVISHPPYFNYLRSFLENLADVPGGRELGIYVLATQTSSEKDAKTLEEITKISGPNVMFDKTPLKMTIGCARNIIAQKGKEDWAVFLDADVTLDKNYLPNLNSFLSRHGDNTDAIAGGIGLSQSSKFGAFEGLMDLMIYVKSMKLRSQKEYLDIMSRLNIRDLVENQRVDEFNQSVLKELQPYEGRPTTALQGFNQIIKRKTFTSLGGFDENMWSAEDREMGIRLTRNGKNLVFVPQILALHNYDFTLKDILKRKRIHGTWYGELRRKFPDDKRLRMSYLRWGRNMLKSFNPPYPFNINLAGRTYYLLSFLNYASSAIVSERLALHKMKNENEGWTYGRDK